MPDNWRQAVHYRNRAQLLRAVADETPRMDHKRALLRVAEYYEKMAESLERKPKPPD